MFPCGIKDAFHRGVAARTGQILSFLVPIALLAAGCADAPVYSVSLQANGQNAAPNEMAFAVTSPQAGKASPIAARLGVPNEQGQPQQYFELGEPIVLRLASDLSDADALHSEVVWTSAEARLVTRPARDDASDARVQASLETPAHAQHCRMQSIDGVARHGLPVSERTSLGAELCEWHAQRPPAMVTN